MSQPVFTPQIETNRTGWRYLSLILPIVIAAICLWMAMPNAAISRGVGFQPANLSSSIQSTTTNAIPVSLPAASSKLITRPIEDIRPGMRVLADNPDETEALPDADVNPRDWRLVSLLMTKEDGGTLHVNLLRSVESLIQEVAVAITDANAPDEFLPSLEQTTVADDAFLQRLLLGQSVLLLLPELGAEGPATVIAIAPCPSIDPLTTGHRLVTGTFHHSAGNVIDIQIGSESQPFGVTDNHPFWSVDRQRFVEAGQLEIGEHLQCADTTITQVTRITPRRGPPVEVYNFEVDAEHVYHVGSSGVLVHNTCYSTNGLAVLGHFPGYLSKAKSLGASRFNIGNLWNRFSPATRTAMNMRFLDKIASMRQKVLLSVPKQQIRAGSALEEEINYLVNNLGYRWQNQWSLVPR